jgi:NDP-sugar pyrophosphorylase family protein
MLHLEKALFTHEPVHKRRTVQDFAPRQNPGIRNVTVVRPWSFTDVVILCGGRGKRLAVITKYVPKPLAPIHNRPFLDILVRHIADSGFRRIILCAGYKAEAIENYYKSTTKEIDIIFSKEKEPLGTGGAIGNAQSLIKSKNFLVVNGDSFCNINLQGILRFHLQRKALCSLALSKCKSSDDVGLVRLNPNKRIIKFNEKLKSSCAKDYINCGIYVFNKKVFSYMPDKEIFSLEYDLFPKLIGREVYGYITTAELIDIGTPQRYRLAQKKLKDFIKKR